MRSYIPFGFWDDKINAADVFLLVTLNVVLTCLISFRLVRAQRRFVSALPNTDHRVFMGAVTILVESAAPVMVFGVGLAVSILYGEKTFRAYQASTIFQMLFNYSAVSEAKPARLLLIIGWILLQTITSQFIIFRVATGTSWANRMDASAILSRSIQFTGPGRARLSEGDEESILQVSELARILYLQINYSPVSWSLRCSVRPC